MSEITHKSIVQNTVAQNAAWLLLAEFVSRGVAFLVIVWLANYLGSVGYGALAYAFAVANILVGIADFGLDKYVVKELSRDLRKTEEYAGKLLTIKCFLAVIYLSLLLVVSSVIPGLGFYVAMLGGVAIILSSTRVYIESFFRAHQRMHLEALSKILSSVLLAVILSYLIYHQASLVNIAAGYCIASLLSVAIALLIMHTSITKIRMQSVSFHYIKTVLHAAWPFAMALAFNYVFNYLDAAMLGVLGFEEETGIYTAAYKPIFFMTAIGGLVISAFFPKISQLWEMRDRTISSTVSQLFRINMLIAIPLAVGGTLLAGPIIDLLYTSEYSSGVTVFQILLWSTVLIFFWASFGNSVQACDGEKTYVRGFAWGAILAIVLNVVLITRYTMIGAAIATLLTQLFLAVYMVIVSRSVFVVPIVHHIWKPLTAAVGMGILLWWLQLELWWSVSLGFMIYILLLYGLRGITAADMRALTTLLRRS